MKESILMTSVTNPPLFFLILVMTGRTGPPDLVMDTQRQGKETELKKTTV